MSGTIPIGNMQPLHVLQKGMNSQELHPKPQFTLKQAATVSNPSLQPYIVPPSSNTFSSPNSMPYNSPHLMPPPPPSLQPQFGSKDTNSFQSRNNGVELSHMPSASEYVPHKSRSYSGSPVPNSALHQMKNFEHVNSPMAQNGIASPMGVSPLPSSSAAQPLGSPYPGFYAGQNAAQNQFRQPSPQHTGTSQNSPLIAMNTVPNSMMPISPAAGLPTPKSLHPDPSQMKRDIKDAYSSPQVPPGPPSSNYPNIPNTYGSYNNGLPKSNEHVPVSGYSPYAPPPPPSSHQQLAYGPPNVPPPDPNMTSLSNTQGTPQGLQRSPYMPTSTRTPRMADIPDGPVGGAMQYDPKLHAKMSGMSISSGFTKLWGNETVNLLQERFILPAIPLEEPKPALPVQKENCSPKLFRSTLTKVPESSNLLQKSRLPFGILIHPFKDVSNLPVVQCSNIVRCRNCRAYINPFVNFLDQHRWQCNLCFRANELPEEFLCDSSSKSCGDPSRRPEMKNATIEFIATSDYMLRPPQPAVYLYLMDVSRNACQTGYLDIFCKTLSDVLDNIPGDSRTKIGFVTFDSNIHFYSFPEGASQPSMLIVSDIEDIFLPSPDNLLVDLEENKHLIQDLLEDLPKRFGDNNTSSAQSCLGAALQVGYKLLSPVGGRMTVFQTKLVDHGPGMLKNREDPNRRAGKDVAHIGPATDFYKKMALECSSQQISVDLFLLCSEYSDISTISCVSKYSSGSVQYYPGFHKLCKTQNIRFTTELSRYLSRKIGFEAVMRIRCTKGITIHTFHGNFFVRSTDLLSLPTVNPDAGYGMQIAIEENLTDSNFVCFQAAVLYTSSNGERRIRVHTLNLPVVTVLSDVWNGADQEAIIGLVSKMAVDRTIGSSMNDARDAMINVAMDVLGAFKQSEATHSGDSAGTLLIPYSLRLLPLFVLALLKHTAFRAGVCTKLDERVYAMERMKTLPLSSLMKYIYPRLYPVHDLNDKNAIHHESEDEVVPQPVILQLSSDKIDSRGAYILDTLDVIYLYIGQAVHDAFCQTVLGVEYFAAIPDDLILYTLPILPTPESTRLRNFISWLQEQRPAHCPIRILKETKLSREIFGSYFVDDKTESFISYFEFLQHLRQQLTK